VQIYFSPDAYDQPFVNQAFSLDIDINKKLVMIGLFSLGDIQNCVDSIFCVGEWQKSTFAQKFSIPESKIYVAGNGFSNEFFGKKLSLKHRAKSLVYASTPYRGLNYLVDYWPEIKSQVPDAKALIMSGMQIYGLNLQEDQKQYGDIYRRASDLGMEVLGCQDKYTLGELFSKTRVMAYPNTFAETFCMAVLEAQSCGLPVVSTNLAGLKERIRNDYSGYLINGHPRDKQYKTLFIDALVNLLQNDSLWQQMSDYSVNAALNYDYAILAKNWELKLQAEIEKNVSSGRVFVPHYNESQAFRARACVLIDGYTKYIEVSDDLVLRSLAEILESYGFYKSASHFYQKRLPCQELR
jgi:glycosyltransferase involved in cell wall biosynthesis